MRRVIPLLLLLFTPAAPSLAQTFTTTVIGVPSGDTVRILRNLQEFKVRLNRVGLPERTEARERARQFTSDLLLNKLASFTVRGADAGGLLVAEVTLGDGRNLNDAILQAGLAPAVASQVDAGIPVPAAPTLQSLGQPKAGAAKAGGPSAATPRPRAGVPQTRRPSGRTRRVRGPFLGRGTYIPKGTKAR